ncbi:MAG TPA: nuclear transport factor 2 family protein [Novosphingobium sp.]|nr:nuclear transport factor 2 family protein [Novosphingobium sp.]HMP56078.1 nuclear transport factor 2 family protein [Novosphingobium sp.]
MAGDLDAIVRELKDRQDIHDCLMRYCRGVDRLDRALLESCYHADAIDDHGAFVGPADRFIDWVLGIYATYKHVSHHEVTNHLCEIDGDTAHAESYWISTTIDRAAPHFSRARGRYIDRFERRDGRWAIAARVCVVEISDGRDDLGLDQLARAFQPRDASDASYQRPLTIALPDPAG